LNQSRRFTNREAQHMSFRKLLTVAVCLCVMVSGCASYRTPARGAQLSALVADEDIGERLARKPAAAFPARLAVARVQDSNYQSYSNESWASGRFSVVINRDVETEKDFERISKLPMVQAVAPLNRMVLPARLDSERDLRLAGASLHADIVLAYTFDTAFRLDETDIGPLGVITLGFMPVNKAVVTSTASAALFDVRTGFVYGLAEATGKESALASAWSTREAADQSRLKAERAAFEGLLTEFEKTWKGIVEEHGRAAAAR